MKTNTSEWTKQPETKEPKGRPKKQICSFALKNSIQKKKTTKLEAIIKTKEMLQIHADPEHVTLVSVSLYVDLLI